MSRLTTESLVLFEYKLTKQSMKTLLILIPGLLIALSLHAQKVNEQNVPESVRQGLPASYGAKKVVWSKEDANYEASFKKDGMEISLVIDPSGKTLETEAEIKKSELPAAINGAIQKEYAGFTVEEAAKIVAADGGVTYEAEVVKGKQKLELIFADDGTLISKEAK